jgi:hypothetical protein
LLKEAIAESNQANKNEINQFRRNISSDVAERIANISHSYPTLDKRIAVYGALSGLDADDDTTLRLAQRQQKALEKQQRSIRQQKVNPLKRATQLSFLALDAPFQDISQNFKSTVVAAQETQTPLSKAVLGNLGTALIPGEAMSEAARTSMFGQEFTDVWKQTKESYGDTEFRRVRDEMKAGNPINLGSGIAPQSVPLEDTDTYRKELKLGSSPTEAYERARQVYGTPITEEFERDEYRYKYTTPSGERIPISPGRIVAGQFSQEGDISYALTSTIIDGAFRLGADPINLLLGYGSGIKTAGQKIVSRAAVDDYVRNTPLIKRSLRTLSPGKKGKEARKFTFGKTAEEILESKWGDDFIDALTKNDSVSRLRDIPTFQKVDAGVLRLLAQVKHKESMKEIVKSLLKHGDLSDLMVAPYSGQFVGKEIAEAAAQTPLTKLPMRRMVVSDLADTLAKKFAGESIDIAPLRKTIGALLGKMKNDPFAGVVGMGGILRNALPKSARLFRLAPSKFASLKYLQETVENIDGLLVTMGESNESRDRFIAGVLTAKTGDDLVKVVQQMNKKIVKFIQKENPDISDVDAEILTEVVNVQASTHQATRKYYYDKDGYAMAFPGTKWEKITKETIEQAVEAGRDADTILHEYHALPTPLGIGQFAEHFIPLMDYQELAKAAASHRRLVGRDQTKLRMLVSDVWNKPDVSLTKKILTQAKLPKRGFTKNYKTGKTSLAPKNMLEYVYSDYLVNRLLKPTWMLRLALAVRVPGEESVRIAFNGGPSVFRHPALLASLKGMPETLGVGRFRVKLPKKPKSIQVKGSMGEELFATRIFDDEIDSVAELIGNPELKEKITRLGYDEIEKVIKTMRLNVNPAGQVGESFLASFLDGNTMTDFAFDEIVGSDMRKLKTQRLNDADIEDIMGPLKNRIGQQIEGTLTGNDFIYPRVPVAKSAKIPEGSSSISIAPYKSTKREWDSTVFSEGIDNVEGIIRKYINDPEIKALLRKEGHVLQVINTDGVLQLNVGVNYVNKLSGSKDAQQALINALTVAIKGHADSVYLDDSVVKLIASDSPINNLLTPTRDSSIWKLKVYNKSVGDVIDMDTQVHREILEYMFDSNFRTARAIISKKGGYAQAAPSGSFFNADNYYKQAMAESTLMKRFRPNSSNRGDLVDYDMAWKTDAEGNVTDDFWSGWIHDMINRASDPLYVVVARDGVDGALEYFTKTSQGKRYIDDLIRNSDDPQIRQKYLSTEEGIRRWLESAQYEIARLQGNNTRKIFGSNNRPISEAQARQIMFKEGGEILFPRYEADLSESSKKIKDFIADGGFLEGEDWLELAEKWSVANSSNQKYQKNFMNKMKKLFKEEIQVLGFGPKRQAFNRNPQFTSMGEATGSVIQKWDDMIGTGYSNLLAKPSDYLNRDPLFRWSFYTLAEDIIPLMTDDVKKEFLVGAKPWVEGSSLWDDLVRASKIPEGENSVTSLEQAETLLKYKAMEEVKNVLYASSDRHVLSDVMSTYVPFPEIWQEVFKTWGKLLVENPAKFNRTRIAIDRGKEAKPWDTDNAFFETDPVTGELMFNYIDVMNVMTFGITTIPGQLGFRPLQSGLLGEDLTDEGVRVKPYGFLEGLNLIAANGFSPGFGPIVTVPYKVFSKLLTFPRFMSDFLLGNFNQPGGSTNLLDELPGYAKSFLMKNPFAKGTTEEIDASYAKTVMDIYMLYYYAGKWDPEDEESMKIALQEAEAVAAKHWRIRGLAQWAFPTAIQPRYQVEDKNGTWWGIEVLSEQYQKMLESNDYDYYVTTQQFIHKYGLNPIPLRQTKSTKKGRYPVRVESYEHWQKKENKALMENFPQTAIYTKMDSWDDEFSYPAYLEGSDLLTKNDYKLAISQSLLKFELEEFKEQLVKDRTLNDNTRQEKYTAERERLEKSYGVISYGNIGVAVSRAAFEQRLIEFGQWENEPLLRSSPEYIPLQLYLNKRDEAIDVLLNGGEFEGVVVGRGGVPNKKARNLKGTNEYTVDVRIALDKFARELAREYGDTNFIDIYLGNFWEELDNRRYEKDF